jgi:hypothetical protein
MMNLMDLVKEGICVKDSMSAIEKKVLEVVNYQDMEREFFEIWK